MKIYKMFEPVLDVLVYMEENRIAHNDLHDENIHFSKKYKTLFLIDFGSVKTYREGDNFHIRKSLENIDLLYRYALISSGNRNVLPLTPEIDARNIKELKELYQGPLREGSSGVNS